MCRLYLGEDKTTLQVKEGMRREVLQALNELAAEHIIKLNEGAFQKKHLHVHNRFNWIQMDSRCALPLWVYVWASGTFVPRRCTRPAYTSTAKFYLNFETIKKMRRMPENLSEEEALNLLSDVLDISLNTVLTILMSCIMSRIKTLI